MYVHKQTFLLLIFLNFLVGELASDHIAGLTFGGMRPHSPDEHVQDPNVLVVHSAEVVSSLSSETSLTNSYMFLSPPPGYWCSTLVSRASTL